jgi:hypothetical protein
MKPVPRIVPRRVFLVVSGLGLLRVVLRTVGAIVYNRTMRWNSRSSNLERDRP